MCFVSYDQLGANCFIIQSVRYVCFVIYSILMPETQITL